MNIFAYDNVNRRIELNLPEILLVDEFKTLLKRDKTKNKDKAFKEFTYIYLAIDWQSVYSQYQEYERHQEALSDAGLTEEEFNDPAFRAACRKYRSIQESNKSIKLLNAAKTAADKLVEYFEDIVDLNERNEATGATIFKAKDVIAEMSNISKVHEQLKALEDLVKKDMQTQSTIRGGAVDGFDPGEL